MITVESVFKYPIKSCAALEFHQSEEAAAHESLVESRSDAILENNLVFQDSVLLDDRRWMILDKHNKFVSQRQFAFLSQVRIFPEPTSELVEPHTPTPYQLTYKNFPKFKLDATQLSDVPIVARLWEEDLTVVENPLGSLWFKTVLQQELKLVTFAPGQVRTRVKSPKNLSLFFADGYPLHMYSKDSLLAISNSLGIHLELNRFRPNIILTGVAAFQESKLLHLKKDNLHLHFMKEATRCTMINVNQTSGKIDNSIFKDLVKLRSPEKPVFGAYWNVIGSGTLKAGDVLEVVS